MQYERKEILQNVKTMQTKYVADKKKIEFFLA